MVKKLSNLDEAKEYRENLAKRIYKQRRLTGNKITKLFVKKSPEKILGEEKLNPEYDNSKDIIRNQHKIDKAEKERQERIKEAKKIIKLKVYHYAVASKDRTIESIEKDIKTPHISSEIKDIKDYFDSSNLLERFDYLSIEEKEVLLNILLESGLKGLPLLILFMKEGNDKAKKYVDNLFIKEINIPNGDYKLNINYPKVESFVDKFQSIGYTEYLENVEKLGKLEAGLASIFLEKGIISDEIVNSVKEFNPKHIQKLFLDKKDKAAIKLFSGSFVPYRERPFKKLFELYEYRGASKESKDSEKDFIESAIKDGSGYLFLDRLDRWGFTAEQEKYLIKTMIEKGYEGDLGKNIEIVSLLYPGLVSQELEKEGKITILKDSKKKLALKDLLAWLDKNSDVDKELSEIINNEKDVSKKLDYLVKTGYTQSSIDLFENLPSTEKNNIPDEILNNFFNMIIDRDIKHKINPYDISRLNDAGRDSGWLQGRQFFRLVPYNIFVFFKCMRTLDATKMKGLSSIVDKVIAKQNREDVLDGHYLGDTGTRWWRSDFWKNYMQRIVNCDALGENSLNKLRKSIKRRDDYWTSSTNLFQERNPVNNPYPDNKYRNKVRSKLGNTVQDNENKKFLTENVKPSTAKNYRGEDVPAIIINGKKVSLLTYHTDNKDICREENGLCYINEGYAEEIATQQGKRLIHISDYISSIRHSAPTGGWDEYFVRGSTLDPSVITDLLGQNSNIINLLSKSWKNKNDKKGEFKPALACE